MNKASFLQLQQPPLVLVLLFGLAPLTFSRGPTRTLTTLTVINPLTSEYSGPSVSAASLKLTAARV